MPWQPDPSWKPMTAGTGQSDGGVWLTPDQRVVKRLLPGVDDHGITPEAGVLERIGPLPPALSACLSIRLTSTL
jgi:hypothetical protein